jgi:hypothetical protein
MDVFDYIIRGFFAVVLIMVVTNLGAAIWQEGIRPKARKKNRRIK